MNKCRVAKWLYHLSLQTTCVRFYFIHKNWVGLNCQKIFPWMEIVVSPRFPREESLKTNWSFFSFFFFFFAKIKKKRPSELSSNLTSSKLFFCCKNILLLAPAVATSKLWRRENERRSTLWHTTNAICWFSVKTLVTLTGLVTLPIRAGLNFINILHAAFAPVGLHQ